MSTEIVPFNFDGEQVRVVTIDGDPWFVLADLCAVLELSNPRMVAQRIGDDVSQAYPIEDALGRMQNTTVVSEAGMYEVVIRSDKPEAAAFRRWITGTVLPEIRRTGSYARPLTLAEKSILLLTELTDEVQRQAAQLEVQKPLVQQALTYQGGDNLTARQAFSREIIAWAVEQGHEVKQQDVFRFLSYKLGLFVRGERADAGEATVDAIRRGLAITQKGTSSTGHNFATGKLTPSGKAYAWERIVRYLEQHGTLRILEAVA